MTGATGIGYESDFAAHHDGTAASVDSAYSLRNASATGRTSYSAAAASAAGSTTGAPSVSGTPGPSEAGAPSAALALLPSQAAGHSGPGMATSSGPLADASVALTQRSAVDSLFGSAPAGTARGHLSHRDATSRRRSTATARGGPHRAVSTSVGAGSGNSISNPLQQIHWHWHSSHCPTFS